MVLVRLPPGMKFKPTDEELVVHYLDKMQKGEPLPTNFVKDCCHIYGKKNPWEVFDWNSNDYSYFFTKLTKRSENRIDRTAGSSGSWKAQHSKIFKSADESVRWCKKDFVFETTDHSDRDDANGHWLMQEYSLLNQREDDFVLCRIRNKAKDPDKKKRVAILVNMFDGSGGVEVVLEATAEEIRCNHELLAASTSYLPTDEERDVQLQQQPKKMRVVSSSHVEGVESRPVNVDAGWNISPLSYQLGALELEQPAMPPLSEESYLIGSNTSSFNSLPQSQDLMFSDTTNSFLPSYQQLLTTSSFNSLPQSQHLMFPHTTNSFLPSCQQLHTTSSFNSLPQSQHLMFPHTTDSFLPSYQQLLTTSSLNSLPQGQDLMFPDTTNSFFPSVSSLPFNPYLPNSAYFPSYI